MKPIEPIWWSSPPRSFRPMSATIPLFASDLPAIIGDVHEALSKASQRIGQTEREELRPAVALKKSVTPDYIVCLEDGKKFKSLKRHLAHPLQPFAGGIPREVGPAARLPDGGPELRGRPLAARQADGPRHPPREIGAGGQVWFACPGCWPRRPPALGGRRSDAAIALPPAYRLDGARLFRPRRLHPFRQTNVDTCLPHAKHALRDARAAPITNWPRQRLTKTLLIPGVHLFSTMLWRTAFSWL